MVQAYCPTPCYDNDLGQLYEGGQSYTIDENKPWNWRHFQFPRDVEPPAEVADMLGLTKADIDEYRGHKLPDKSGARKLAEAEKKVREKMEK
jgi:hypothetical protein